MAYTRKDSPLKINGGQPSVYFGPSVNDGNRVAIVGTTNGINTNDGAATPVLSPVAVSAGVNTVITVPGNALSITIIASAAVNVSEVVGFTQFATIPANVPTTINVARQKFLYFQGASTLSFIFNILD
jgi:hypothetical protein